jgi:hypothetical protein
VHVSYERECQETILVEVFMLCKNLRAQYIIQDVNSFHRSSLDNVLLFALPVSSIGVNGPASRSEDDAQPLVLYVFCWLLKNSRTVNLYFLQAVPLWNEAAIPI